MGYVYDKTPITINSQEFVARDDCKYFKDYGKIPDSISKGLYPEWDLYRTLCMDDLWFLIYFGMGVKIANHPFWVEACKEVQKGPKTCTLDMWAREHGKSTIITKAETIQDIFNNPEERVCIFSYTRPIAIGFVRSIKQILEESEFLKWLFPDILYKDPKVESPKWTEDSLLVRRKGFF